MTQPPFQADYQVTWQDLDANNHMANVRYLDYAAQTRFLYLSQAGFPPSAFAAAGMGPVVFEDKVQYRRELRLLDRFRVGFTVQAQSPNGAKFVLINRIQRENGDECATVITTGAWFDLRQRKVTEPPAELRAAMDQLAREPDFQVL